MAILHVVEVCINPGWWAILSAVWDWVPAPAPLCRGAGQASHVPAPSATGPNLTNQTYRCASTLFRPSFRRVLPRTWTITILYACSTSCTSTSTSSASTQPIDASARRQPVSEGPTNLCKRRSRSEAPRWPRAGACWRRLPQALCLESSGSAPGQSWFAPPAPLHCRWVGGCGARAECMWVHDIKYRGGLSRPLCQQKCTFYLSCRLESD